ncbi:hypothetical protein BGZ76_000606 [Entomortierella beljakovae]|nr:hypothetical protein BGZ76_000606 [Entomortierella beljakovae]
MTSMETTVDAGLIPILEDQVVQLANHEEWLDAQIKELEFANNQDLDNIPINDNSTEEQIREAMEKRIDILKQELVALASMESIRTKALNNAYGYLAVLKGLFKGDHDSNEKSLAKSIEERDEAVSVYLHIHQELQQSRRELSTVQVQVLDCQDENRQLVQLLSDETTAMKEATTSQDTGGNKRMAHRMEEELKNINIKHNVISNVLQGLLLESGVDWADDPHYLDVMLKLKRSSE